MEASTISEKLNKQRSQSQCGRNLGTTLKITGVSSREKLWTRGRRLAWSSNRWRWNSISELAMCLLHFSAFSSPFSFWESLIGKYLAEGENYEKRQHCQMPLLWKHKELERWSTLSPFWRNSAIFMQRMRQEIFLLLGAQTFFFFVCSLQEVFG